MKKKLQNNYSIRQLSRQNHSGQSSADEFFFETDYFQFERKTGPDSFEHRTFGIAGVFVTSRLSVPETPKFDLIMNQSTLNDSSDSVKLVVNPKKVYIPV